MAGVGGRSAQVVGLREAATDGGREPGEPCRCAGGAWQRKGGGEGDGHPVPRGAVSTPSCRLPVASGKEPEDGRSPDASRGGSLPRLERATRSSRSSSGSAGPPSAAFEGAAASRLRSNPRGSERLSGRRSSRCCGRERAIGRAARRSGLHHAGLRRSAFGGFRSSSGASQGSSPTSTGEPSRLPVHRIGARPRSSGSPPGG